MLVDVDGVLADLRPFEHELSAGGETGARKRWTAFFAHIPEAGLIEAGAELVHALTAIGARVQYSTTRPYWAARATRDWMATRGLPAGYLYSRSPGNGKTGYVHSQFPTIGPAATIKAAHCAFVHDRDGLGAFIDDEPDAVTTLRHSGYPAVLLSELSAATTQQLHSLTRHRRLVSMT
ncbi:hypothetical protein [Cryptosporangium phraense]|uniref:Uncharacterized protein n=1 Tax=Cryptosporangium phraense TaxID=2593070 RepID=A0A545AND5_9ACTN|nr:hypothetical protein [Cryptosporangium phraense]TQS42848.1 hypothetical protein FL583_22625 [Cryptosporangium phraense]